MVVVPCAAAAAATASAMVLGLGLIQHHHLPGLLLQHPAQRVELPAGPAPLPLLVPGIALAVHEEAALWGVGVGVGLWVCINHPSIDSETLRTSVRTCRRTM
jgi:hypothetical protein